MIDSSDDYVHQDQLYLIFHNLFHSLLCSFLYYSFSILHLFSMGAMYPINFVRHMFRESWNLFWAIIEDGQKVLSFLKLIFVILIILLKSLASYVMILDPEDNFREALEAYKKMKIILNDFGVLPLSEHDSLIAYLILKKIPDFMWINLIPFPSFLFEDTFSKAAGNDTIMAQLPPPEGVTVLMVKSKVKKDEFNENRESISRNDSKATPQSDGESASHSGKIKSSQHLTGRSTPQSDNDKSTTQEYSSGQPSSKMDTLKNLLVKW